MTIRTHSVSRQPGKKAQDVRKPLSMRIKPETRRLPDLVTESTGKTLTDFVLDTARQAAQSALLDRSAIPADKQVLQRFPDAARCAASA